MDMSNIDDTKKLEHTVNQLGMLIRQAWTKNAKKSKISKHSKQWWMEEYSRSLNNYRTSRSLENWKKFKKVVKDVKRSFLMIKFKKLQTRVVVFGN